MGPSTFSREDSGEAVAGPPEAGQRPAQLPKKHQGEREILIHCDSHAALSSSSPGSPSGRCLSCSAGIVIIKAIHSQPGIFPLLNPRTGPLSSCPERDKHLRNIS